MKLSIKNLIIILGVLVIGFIILQYTKRDNKSKALKSELVSIDTAFVTKVEIFSPAGEVKLTKEGKDWMVALPNDKKQAKTGVVTSILNSLNSIKPGRLAAKKEGKWKDYQVDSTGTRVKVYEGSDAVTDIVLGRFGVEGQRSYYTFVRLFDDQNVYTANNFMKMSIYENTADYRNNVLLTLRTDSLSSIAFTSPQESFHLNKTENGWFVDNQSADSASVASYLNDLSMLSSKNFYDGILSGTATHQLEFTFFNKESIIVDGFETEVGIILKSNENQTEAFLDPAISEKLWKRRSVFLATKD